MISGFGKELHDRTIEKGLRKLDPNIDEPLSLGKVLLGVGLGAGLGKAVGYLSRKKIQNLEATKGGKYARLAKGIRLGAPVLGAVGAYAAINNRKYIRKVLGLDDTKSATRKV